MDRDEVPGEGVTGYLGGTPLRERDVCPHSCCPPPLTAYPGYNFHAPVILTHISADVKKRIPLGR